MIDYKAQGRKNRAAGQRFERKVRNDLEKKGWNVSKWQNNVEFWKENIKGKEELIYDWEEDSLPFGKLVPAKMGRFRTNQGGFPDFIIFKQVKLKEEEKHWTVGEFVGPCKLYEVIGVESKSRGYLTKEERLKCKWLLRNNVFSKIRVARKGKEKGEIIYNEIK